MNFVVHSLCFLSEVVMCQLAVAKIYVFFSFHEFTSCVAQVVISNYLCLALLFILFSYVCERSSVF